MTSQEKRELFISYREQTIVVLENLLSKMDPKKFMLIRESEYLEQAYEAIEFYQAIFELKETLVKMNKYSKMILDKQKD